MPTELFLNPTELRSLTGFSVRLKQIQQLRKMGIPFRINGCGRAVVTRCAVEGGVAFAAPINQSWTPSLLQSTRRVA